MQQLLLKIDAYLKDTVVEFRNTTNYQPYDNLLDSMYQALKGKVEIVIENFAFQLKKQLSKLILNYNKSKKEHPEYLASFSQNVIRVILSDIGTTLLLKNPSIISAEPTADDTLFFTAKYAQKTCYVEVHFEENEEPVCVLNIYENKKIIINRIGTIQNVMNIFLSLENIAVV
ncbi:MAG: hypothetical protein RLZZ292_621 [Bacteroidota bacterium]|jgi:hypothetical protein